MGIPLIRIRCYPQYRWMGVTRDNGTKKKDRKRLRHHSSYHPKIMFNVTGKVTYQKKKKKCIGALQTQSYPPRTHRLPLLRTPMVAVHLLLGFRGAPSGRREGGFDSWRGVRLDLEGTDNLPSLLWYATSATTFFKQTILDGTCCGVQRLRKGLSPAQPRNFDLFDYCDAALINECV